MASIRHRVATATLTGTGVLLLAGTAACGTAGDDPGMPSPTASQAARSSPSSGTQQEPEATTTVQGSRTTTPKPEHTPVALDDALIEKAQDEGTVSVIVTLDVPYRPEAELAGPAEVEAQRAAIAAAQDELVASVPDATVTTRMRLFPQIVFSVDEEALRQLAASPLVLSVNENSLDAPTT